VAGLTRYGLMPHALRIFSGLFDVSIFMDLHRMPELFCGFPRRPGEGPTSYPVSCSPQSWAAASGYAMLQSVLGLVIDAPHRLIRFTRPVLPESIERLRLTNLRVADATVDLLLERSATDVRVELLRRTGDVEIHTVR